MKLLGAIVIIVATTLFGFRVAALYQERPRQIRALKRALTQLQAEVEYQLTPLPQALSHVAAKCGQPLSQLFENVRERLQSGGVTIREAFQSALAQLETDSALSRSDCDAVLSVAETLSTTDLGHLDTQFQLSIDTLSAAETEAMEQGTRNARLWQYLGVLSGVMVVILLY